MLKVAFNLKIVIILAIGFALASILGYLSFLAKLSPILGYLLAGYLIGPYSPGFVADLSISEQLAEIGVILMMFSVGMHFKWEDLMNVKKVAIPGAIGQTFIATLLSVLLIYNIGWTFPAAIIFGLAIGVASTVVLVQMLSDNHLLDTVQGHVSVGWLIVEDIITVVGLLLMPILVTKGEELNFQNVATLISTVIFKFSLLSVFLFTLGRPFVRYVLSKVLLTKSPELFTSTMLALTFIIALGSSILFGTSIALGAFIAGMLLNQTELKREIFKIAMPLKNAFVVIFFLSVGMLFNPFVIIDHFLLFIGVLAIILIVKPLAAFVIAIALKSSFKTALTVAVALAQIGEFSLILSEEANRIQLLPDEGYDVIVACVLTSISLNPLFFKLLKKQLGIKVIKTGDS
jgi:CPA2 family monovalent cation:H+ antiporter-2